MLDEIPVDETDNKFVEKGSSGKGVKLGSIVQSTKVVPTDGQNSPMTYGEDNLDEDNPYADDDDYSDLGHYEPSQRDMDDYYAGMQFATQSDSDIENAQSMISSIKNMQDMGLSKATTHYDDMDFQNATPSSLKQMYNNVMNGITEGPSATIVTPIDHIDSRLSDILTPTKQVPTGNSAGGSRMFERVSILEQIKWDEDILEAFIEESSLSKLIGRQQGGQNLVRWLHKKHKLGNEAELVPAPFNERIFWKQFKSNPDDFIIVTAQNGVAGIKPPQIILTVKINFCVNCL